MAKNNIRSVRFSDEMIEIINQQVGDNFTQKFERMVYNCYMLLPEKQAQADRLDMLIKDKREALNKLQDRYYTGVQFLNALEARLRDLNRLFDAQSQHINSTLRRGSDLAAAPQRVTWRGVSKGSWLGSHPRDGGSTPPPATIKSKKGGHCRGCFHCHRRQDSG